ncbi:MAG: sigma-70 family RNA polymerase sigma factor [Candidatus Acidiferrales bacterium]
MSEAALVLAAKSGQRAAFETLCERSSQRLLRTTLRITRNREDAEDAVQDTFLRAFMHVKDFDGRSSFSTWLTRIAINSAVMILRKKRPGREVSVDSFADKNETGASWELSDPTPSPETQYVEEEQRRLLWGAISALRPSIRKVVEFQLSRDCAVKETARTIGLSLFAAKSRLFHAKAAIRKSMKRSRIGRAPLLRTRPRFIDGTAA